MAKAKSLGIVVARLIVAGDVQRARVEAQGSLWNIGGSISWTVPEARAIAGACRYAATRYNAPVTLAQFMGGN